MRTRFLKRSLARSDEAPPLQTNDLTSQVSRIAFVIVALCLIVPTLAVAQGAASVPPIDTEAQKCAALTDLNLESTSAGPAFITSAQLVDVPAAGLERPAYAPSGYGSTNGLIQSGRVHQFCDVTGYVAPQNRLALLQRRCGALATCLPLSGLSPLFR